MCAARKATTTIIINSWLHLFLVSRICMIHTSKKEDKRYTEDANRCLGVLLAITRYNKSAWLEKNISITILKASCRRRRKKKNRQTISSSDFPFILYIYNCNSTQIPFKLDNSRQLQWYEYTISRRVQQ